MTSIEQIVLNQGFNKLGGLPASMTNAMYQYAQRPVIRQMRNVPKHIKGNITSNVQATGQAINT